MKIGIIGYGKMGQAIEKTALANGHMIAWKIDQQDALLLDKIDKATVDIAIEFTTPSTAYHNIYTCLEKGIPVISGTTGWLTSINEITTYCQQQKGTFFYSPNFSIGANVLFKMNVWLAKVMQHYPNFKPSIAETHAISKKDAPSGTAIQLATALLAHNQHVERWDLVTEKSNIAPNILPIHVNRTLESTMYHTVSYSSDCEGILIQHTAQDRTPFANGVMAVAIWLKDKKGFYTMDHFLTDLSIACQ